MQTYTFYLHNLFYSVSDLFSYYPTGCFHYFQSNMLIDNKVHLHLFLVHFGNDNSAMSQKTHSHIFADGSTNWHKYFE